MYLFYLIYKIMFLLQFSQIMSNIKLWYGALSRIPNPFTQPTLLTINNKALNQITAALQLQ